MTDLAELIDALPADLSARSTGDASTPVRALTLDSRQVVPGALFACLAGSRADGHDFAAAAVASGATSLLVERHLPLDVAQIVVRDARRALGWMAAAFHGDPSSAMAVVGITGTNGKTTTAHLLGAILRHAGRQTAVLGTLSGAFTTPEAPDLQADLARLRADGTDVVVMEVSSHTLALERVAGTRFALAAFTNLGRDHLDFHGTEERYFSAKASLFTPERSAKGVVWVDDDHGRRLADTAAIPIVEVRAADAQDVVLARDTSSFAWRGEQVRLPIPARHNVANALVAATLAEALGLRADAIAAGLSAAAPVPGRLEPVVAGQPFGVLVDFAHTPEALASLLDNLRELTPSRLIVVFGCGGDRDAAKRPLMGAVATERADVVIVTSDNPRSEDPEAIIEAVISGIDPQRAGAVRRDPDRRAAIGSALALANRGDIVVIAGKGHETTQTAAGHVRPFDDRAVARELPGGSTVIALLISGAVAMLVSLFGTRFLIAFFRERNLGQPILGKEDRGPEQHMHKEGTPTMGGIAILAAAAVGYFVAHARRGLVFADQSLIILGGIFLMAGLGFIDDYIKVRIRRNRGVFWKKKGWITLGLSALIAVVLVTQTGIDTRVGYTRADLPGWDLGKVGWVIWAALIIFATVNAVNVTDGLDGLAAGSGLFGFFAFTVMAFWGFRNPDLYGSIVNPLDLAAVAVAFAGACAGFLWWNAAPARIIMGDVGALGLGAALALLALSTNTHLLLPLICGLYVMEIGSVALQMSTYKLFDKRRIFRMSPVHHHFELVGWPETTVIIRFWIIAGICVAAALALYYADFARNEGFV